MARFSAVDWRSYHFFYRRDRDLLLVEFVRPVIAALLADRLIDRFFFIRYPEGGPHVRLRVRLAARRAGVAAMVEESLQATAARFLQRWPPQPLPDTGPGEAAHGLRPHPDGVLLPFPFEPETERYGGAELLPHSMDFFAVSSVRVLELVAARGDETPGRRLAGALRLLLQQAVGFARDEAELWSLLSYRLPMAKGLEAAVHEFGDRRFEVLREDYRALFLREAEAVAAATHADPPAASGAWFVEAARRLSQAVRPAAPDARWQIGTSQMHMTANRLGVSINEEIYLGRILWRAARDLAETDPASWRALVEALAAGRHAAARRPGGLGDLLEARFRRLARSVRPASVHPATGNARPGFAAGGVHAGA